MGELPERIGLCANRVGDSKYVVAGVFLTYDADPKELICEHCGQPLIIYSRERTSLNAVDG